MKTAPAEPRQIGEVASIRGEGVFSGSIRPLAHAGGNGQERLFRRVAGGNPPDIHGPGLLD